MLRPYLGHPLSKLGLTLPLLLVGGCASLGKVMSPYSETFSCKNSDHGQCIDPAQAHADAVAGTPSRSNPAVTRDRSLLQGGNVLRRPARTKAAPYVAYQDSVYRELQGLIDAPETPMLRQGRTVRTLILPYASAVRPDRLYMPRFVYSILERPQWVVGDYLVREGDQAARMPVLRQEKERSDTNVTGPDAPAQGAEVQP